MRYRLGSFMPRPGSSDFEAFLTSEDLGAPMTRALEEMLRLRLSRATPGPLPDLLDTVGPRHPDRPWVEAVYEHLDGLRRHGLELRLLACEYEDHPNRFLTIAATAPAKRLEVLPDDWMQLGFAAIREGESPVRAWPRLYREVCANGSLVCVEELERHDGAEEIGEAVERFLDPALYEPVVQALREARANSVSDPRDSLDELQRIEGIHDLFRAHFERAARRFVDDGDYSLYGLMNAVSATARDVDDWPERLDLEELAGRLALLRRPVPRRSGGAVLAPA